MDFTREPTIETIITPKEGYKLVIRSSKGVTQEEYFVDAVEMVAFGNLLFFRSLERYKAFLLPVSDYEVVEVKEARVVLKTAVADRSIKIGGGKEAPTKYLREEERAEKTIVDEKIAEESPSTDQLESPVDVRIDKKRDRRKHYRKRRGREEGEKSAGIESGEAFAENFEKESDETAKSEGSLIDAHPQTSSTLFSSLLQPPPTLISETIGRYRQNELFKSAFFLTEEEQYKPHEKVEELLNEDEGAIHLQEPTYEASPENEEMAEGAREDETKEELVQIEPASTPLAGELPGSFEAEMVPPSEE